MPFRQPERFALMNKMMIMLVMTVMTKVSLQV